MKGVAEEDEDDEDDWSEDEDEISLDCSTDNINDGAARITTRSAAKRRNYCEVSYI